MRSTMASASCGAGPGWSGKRNPRPVLRPRWPLATWRFQRVKRVIARVFPHRLIHARGRGKVDIGTDQVDQAKAAQADSPPPDRPRQSRRRCGLLPAAPAPRRKTGRAQRLTMKPGRSGHSITVLPAASVRSRASVTACAEVPACGASSTSFIAVGGLKKCSARMRSGWRAPLAMVATGIDEVLVASTAVSDRMRFQFGEKRLLCLGLFDDGLDHQSAGGKGGKRFDDVQVGQGGVAGRWGKLACADAGVQRLCHAGTGVGAGGGVCVGCDHRVSGGGVNLRNAKAHGAKADDADLGLLIIPPGTAVCAFRGRRECLRPCRRCPAAIRTLPFQRKGAGGLVARHQCGLGGLQGQWRARRQLFGQCLAPQAGRSLRSANRRCPSRARWRRQ